MSNALKNAIFVLLCLAGLWVAARGLVATSTAESLATLIVAAIVLPIIGAFGTALLIMATMDRTRPRYEPPPAIQTDYSVLPAWQRPQLAPPRVVHAGRYIDNGDPRPMGIAPLIIETTAARTDERPGEHLSLGSEWLERFAELPTPARSEWTGDRAKYTEAGRIYLAQGMLTKTANGGYAWRPEYPLSKRREWLAHCAARVQAQA